MKAIGAIIGLGALAIGGGVAYAATKKQAKKKAIENSDLYDLHLEELDCPPDSDLSAYGKAEGEKYVVIFDDALGTKPPLDKYAHDPNALFYSSMWCSFVRWDGSKWAKDTIENGRFSKWKNGPSPKGVPAPMPELNSAMCDVSPAKLGAWSIATNTQAIYAYADVPPPIETFGAFLDANPDLYIVTNDNQFWHWGGASWTHAPEKAAEFCAWQKNLKAPNFPNFGI